jgi:hypothetical protein
MEYIAAIKIINLEEQKRALLLREKALNFSSWEGITLLLAIRKKAGKINKNISMKIHAFQKPISNSGMRDITSYLFYKFMLIIYIRHKFKKSFFFKEKSPSAKG